MIAYSEGARRAYARLYRQYNDIDIYVEDSTYVGVYERLINKTLAGRAKVTRVIPLGPREKVLEQAMADNQVGGRPRIYIVDGDLDLIAWGRSPRAPYLYTLRVYHFENLLMERAALEAFCCYAQPKAISSVAINNLGLASLIRQLDEILIKYIAVLAIARRLKLRGTVYALSPPSVARNVGGRYVEIDQTKTFSRTKEIIKSIKTEQGTAKFLQSREAIRSNIRRKRLSPLAMVPAKQFIIWILNQKIGHVGGISLTQPAIVSYLAEHCTLMLEPDLKRRIRRLGAQAVRSHAP